MSLSKEREAAVPGVTTPTGRAVDEGRLRPWWVVAATMAVLLVLLCVRNRFLFTTRLYEDADMGANSHAPRATACRRCRHRSVWRRSPDAGNSR